MDNFDELGVNFNLHPDEVKRQADQVKKNITGVAVTQESIAKKVSATISKQLASQSTYNSKVDELTQRLIIAKSELDKTNTSIKGLSTSFNSGSISRKQFDSQLNSLSQRQIALRTEIFATTGAIKHQQASILGHNKSLQAGQRKFDTFGNSINQVTREMPAFAVSAQIGFLALSNNIPILADEINKLKMKNLDLAASGQKTVPIWKQITKSLLSWQTMMSLGITLVTIYGREIGAWIEKVVKGKRSVDALKASQDALNKSFESSDYKSALKDVNELTSNIDLAKSGMIDAKSVVEQYNESIGLAAGEVQTLAEAEQGLIDNADNYVQMILYKTAAALASDQAAQKLFETQQKRFKLENDIRVALAADAAVEASNSSELDKVNNNTARQRIKSLYAELAELNSKSNKDINDLNDVFKNLNKTAAGFGLDPFLKKNKTNGGKTVVSNRQSLLDRIAAIDKEYARKKLDSDEAEVQALEDKLTRMRELIERFNADPKNKGALIAMGDFDSVAGSARDNLAQTQDDRRLEQSQKEADRVRQQQEKEWQALLLSLRNYEQKREDMINEYQTRRKLLIRKGEQEAAEELDEQHKSELSALDDAHIKKEEAYKQLYEGITGLTRDAAQKIIADAKELIATQELSAEMKADILQKIAETEQALLNTDIDNIRQIASAITDLGHSFIELGEALGLSDLSGAGSVLDTLGDSLNAVLNVVASGGNPVVAISEGLSMISGFVSDLANSAKERKAAEEAYYRSVIQLQQEYNLELNEQIRLSAELSENPFITDYLGRMESAFAALRGANQGLAGAMENLQGGKIQTGSHKELDFSNILKGYLAGGGAAGAIVGAIFGKKQKKEWSDLLDTVGDLLIVNGELDAAYAQILLDTGLLNGETAEMLQTAIEWQEAIEAARQQISDVVKDLSGQAGNELRNSLVDAFRNGEDAALAMGDTVEGVLESIVSQLIFNEVFGQAFDRLSEEMENSFDIGGDQSWVDDFGRFFEDAQNLTGDFNQALKDAADEAGDFGLDLFSPDDSGSGLTGAIQREMTEATASELTGIFRASFDLHKRQVIMSEERSAMEQQSQKYTFNIMRDTAFIRENTASTATQLVSAVAELKKISNNTKQNSTGEDRGY